MNGAKDTTNGASAAASGAASPDDGLERVSAARERFAAGADTVHGVRPEILMSWYRCREQYEVDPDLDRAPAAAAGTAHSMEHDVVFAELGGLAARAAGEVDGLDGLVTVADSDGRVLASWGSRRVLHLAEDHNLAAWSAWSEWASGTNGTGTALESHRPVLVRGPEHWCQGFHHWSSAGVAVRDVVTRDPLGALQISCWQTPLSDAVLPWLHTVAASTEAKLRRRAHHTGTLLAAALADARVPPATPLAAVDTAGKVVLANGEAAVLLGTPADTPACAPAHRWTPQVRALPQLARRATERARQDPCWSGSTLVYVPFLDTPVSVAVRPVFDGSQVLGALLAFGPPDPAGSGEPLDEPGPRSAEPRPYRDRVIALRDDRWVLLDPREIRFAEVDHNNVWLTSDQGRLLAVARGLDRLEQELGGKGFMRVHRRFLVNLGRVREIEQGFKGALFLATDTRPRETVPVARRHIPYVRQALGL
ncbi:DNA-binding protein [Geodermatophilus obscurus]|uniref:LytTr DNA-binding region n=1 Tax=Geodermatophilus obscurus (strain ATCC 25078 / DSM 43160 / JCM 3152 / CCUG 61914 / KCC A-0152 / KCTC 9177 / NBRC 13315 / NRRL B-3577 / G-20) TaxID=526225 RepID=D2S4C9_GEOOG|nr:DNA-binding protein [Geodermatophilus obscurus]ADB75119.1 LytTr DNA-binding region [Geodermatophilus obscurus DSM 43160]